MLTRSGDPCEAIAQTSNLSGPSGADSGMPLDDDAIALSGSQNPGTCHSGRLDFAQWTLTHYMRRPEPERALFWKEAPWGIRQTMDNEIQGLSETHVTRKQALQRGWVNDVA